MRVFYEDWQMECCGTPFAVGDEMVWKLVPHASGAVRDGDGHGAEAWVENHGGPDEETVGRVRAVDLVRQEYLARHDPRPVEPTGAEPGTVTFRATGRALEAVAGARTLEPADACPKWFGRFEDEEQPPREVPYRVRRAVGALVTLDVPDGTPPKPGDHR
ncbi:DUF6578 domain-containing protein [Streptomyces sp. NPDC046759]|uniref:DUF6578 domain-containing protein n=1 Tax=Streptomyces sp. NPDC046759 TaxID=3155019 RepID=UPI0033FE3FE2